MTKQRGELLEEVAAAAREMERSEVGHSEVCHRRLSARSAPYSGVCICGRDRLRAALLALSSAPDEPSAELTDLEKRLKALCTCPPGGVDSQCPLALPHPWNRSK